MKLKAGKLLGIIFVTGVAAVIVSFTIAPESGRIKVYLQNKCSSDVKVKVESPGSSTYYTVDDGTSKPMTFMEGTKIYDSEGHLAHEVTSSSEGKTVVVCD